LPVTLPPGEQVEVQLATVVSQPTLWHFDQPHLYRWVAVLRTADGDVLHTAAVRFGIRTVELKEAGLYLNGEPVRLVGLTRQADSPAHGLAETVTVMAADYADLKTLNTVLTRPVHYPQAEFIMEYADRAGLLLIPEVPAWQLTAAQMADPHMRALEQQQLREMITTQWNHPSVWAWSVGNEVESRTPAGHEFIRDMIAYAKALDPTRPVGFASNRLKSDPAADATAPADFIMMNQYFGTWDGPKDGLGPALDAIHATWPDKPIIISEYGFEPRWQRLWKRPILIPSRHYLLPEDVPADALRRRLIVEQLAALRQKPFVAGAIFLTYQDYRTPTDYHMGVVDAQRRRRESWGLLREEYAPVLIDAVTVAQPSARLPSAEVVLRTRGPLEDDMPAYTLRGYRLHWVVSGSADGSLLSEREVALPTLAPGTTWSAPVEWPAPVEDYVLTVRLVRPTGFVVLERAYDSRGNPRPPP
jgi:beta-glucuronidase